MLQRILLAYVVLGLLDATQAAGAPPGDQSKSKPSPASSAGNGEALAGPLRELLLRNLPTPLYEASPGWGHTVKATPGISRLHTHRNTPKGEKNDGIWKKVRITAENLPDSLSLELRHIEHPEPGRTTFAVLLAFGARVEYEQQKWKAGIRLYSGSARARLRVRLALDCELTSRLEWGGNISPDVLFRLRVVRSNLTYDHLVVEHILGVGGDAAKLLGEAIQHGIHHWRPSLERNLLTRANAAIEKAADTKEIRIGLGSLLKQNKPMPVTSQAK